MTTEAVIVSTARTGVGKAYRGALNNTEGPTLAGHVMAEAVKRAGIAPGEVEDVVMGCAMQQGTMVMNVARKGAIRAGLPVTVAGTTIDRQCASGLQAIAVAARSVMHDGVEIAIGGGIESISLVQNEHMNRFHAVDDELMAMKPEIYMSMLETAEVVASRYNIGRDRQDEYSLECQRRVGAALQGGRFNDEIVPITTKMAVVDKDTKEVGYQQVTLTKDEGPRPDTTAEGLAKIKPVFEGKTISAGNASQLSDGASACVIMSDKIAAQKGLKPLGIFRGFVAAGVEPDEMGVGPVVAIPRLLKRHGLKIDDIDLWELNEAYAVQVIYCRDKLGIDPDKLNVNGGSIAIGHPYGMTGARLTGHLLIEGPAAQGKIRRGDHVHRWRHGCSGSVRNRPLIGKRSFHVKTAITELFGIQHPIIQGGMHYVGFAELAAAVSNAGGLGIITGLTQKTPELLAKEIARCRDMTDKPFGVNLTFLPSFTAPPYPEYIAAISEGGVKAVETAGRSPEQYMPALKAAGIKVIHKCTSVRHSLKAEKIGCDAVSVDGFECGGHPGEDDIPNMILLPRAADELKIPFVASGGMADARSLVAALSMGAAGMNMGTRFIATKEAPVHPNVKKALVEASELDTVLVMRALRNTERVLKNKGVDHLLEIEREKGASLKIADIHEQVAGVYPKVMLDGEMDAGAWSCGMVVGLIHDIPTVKELIDRIMADAEQIIRQRLVGFLDGVEPPKAMKVA